jgi:hypothetical protein
MERSSPMLGSESEDAGPGPSGSGEGAGDPARRIGRWRVLPWAGILALLVVAGLDWLVFGGSASWDFFDAQLRGPHLLERGVIQDQLALRRLESAAAAVPRVFIVGSSRVNRGFHPGLAPQDELPDAHLTKLAHPQMFAFEMRAAVDTIREFEPAAVVFGLSELETHSRIKLVPGSSFGSLGAIADLTREAGLGFGFDRRVMLYRIALGEFFDTYHYRGLLAAAGLRSLRHFERDTRLRLLRFSKQSVLYTDGEPMEIPEPDLQRIVMEFDQRFPGRGSMIERAQFGILRSIARGNHARISMGLVRRAIRGLREDGIPVALVEPPIYPGAELLYDASIRDDFLAFAAELERDLQVYFIPLERAPEYLKRDFGDLTHLERSGSAKFTGVVLSAVRELLGRSGDLQPGSRPRDGQHTDAQHTIETREGAS